MAQSSSPPAGPDFADGVAAAEIPTSGFLAGHVRGEPILVSGSGGRFHAIGGLCTHYGAPLSEGLAVGETVRCPWHHACFSLRTGAALKAPAFDGLARWRVELRQDRLFVRTRIEAPAPKPRSTSPHPRKFVIVGGGAAGFAAAEMLRRRGFDGELTMLSEDSSPPYDRPNLSKDYLAGTAPEDWIPLKPAAFYEENGIDLRLGAAVHRLDLETRQAVCADGAAFSFDALLLATGAEPVRPEGPGLDGPGVHTLRTLDDARAIVAAARPGGTAIILGASFIGLEAAAALRARRLTVHVVAPDAVPMRKVLGAEIGLFVRGLHERHGIIFHLGRRARRYGGRRLELDDGATIGADLIVAGIGVRPRTSLAEECGLAVDNGVVVDEYLETGVPGIFAAGDIANHKLPGGDRARIEHWVIAQRQGQVAALNMLGERTRYAEIPFFWSRHYDATIHYVGHAASWDETIVSGSIAEGDGTMRYLQDGRSRALASIGRPLASLVEEARAEAEAAGGPADRPS